MQDMERYILDHFDEALERHYIEAYCQPVIRIASGQICGMEALARWNDPELGVLTPDKFISVLERNRRIHELDSYIVRQVCERFPSADSEGFVPVSINLSRLDYELCDIFEVVDEAVRANKVLRSQLCIEITESVLNSNDMLMRRYIRRFQQAGYQVWMDDFGSGYSSLNVLKDYRFDELKIDMAFLSDFGPRSKTILASIINMAKQIGIQTLTEGVETAEQFEFLRNVGCEKAQGNLFGSAMPYGELPRFAREHGLHWESPRHRKYYDDIGKLNVLSATPFLSAGDGIDPGTGRDLNSIALSVVELNAENASMLYCNDAFEQTISGVNWLTDPDVGDPLRDGTSVPLGKITAPLRRLLEETQAVGNGCMNFVEHDDYYEVRTKRLASYSDRCSILTHIVNLSQGAALARQTALDDGLRQIYSIFERVSMIDLNNDRVEPLFLDPREAGQFPPRRAREAARLYAEACVFPEDRERYLRFVDADTLAYRLSRQGNHSLASYFRTIGNHGAYSWKCFTVVQIRDGVFFVLVRDTQAEMRELESYYLHPVEGEDRDAPIPAAYLWENVKRNSPLKFFWKDRDRRFLGASQSFLDYYGFTSLKDIVGKTDEDMGWHLHPEDYRESELRVLHEGVASHHRPGSCIVRGENRSIVASKMPIYDSAGDIIGLMGYFSEAGIDRADTDVSSVDIRMDKLTGLLNTRGLDEDMYAYRDEYDLRQTDFVRVEICVEELGDVNRRFGYDFGDSTLRVVANALVTCCGQNATVGRLTGSEFIVFAQCGGPDDINALTERIRAISSQPLSVEGIPFTVYLSVGAAAYSETKDLSLQAISAKLRRLTENVEKIPQRHLREHMSNIFFLYESLPLAFAVHKVTGSGEDADAIILYANKKYTALVGHSAEELIGARVRRIFPMQSGKWMDMACRAAAGETITQKVFYEPLGYHMSMTANQIIGPGYCAFTYRVEERL